MNQIFQGWAAASAGAKLDLLTFDVGPLRPEQVQVKVETCCICHSDLSMLDNEWGNSRYPLVAGHEVIGVIGLFGSTGTRRAAAFCWGGARTGAGTGVFAYRRAQIGVWLATRFAGNGCDDVGVLRAPQYCAGHRDISDARG